MHPLLQSHQWHPHPLGQKVQSDLQFPEDLWDQWHPHLPDQRGQLNLADPADQKALRLRSVQSDQRGPSVRLPQPRPWDPLPQRRPDQ